MKIAVVKWFRYDENNIRKCMGYLVLEDRSELFFHWGARCGVRVTETDEIEFDPFVYPARKPVPGDRVIYQLGSGPMGEKAGNWAYVADYLTAKQQIEDRKKAEQREKERLEEERLQCNPNFQVWEQREYVGGRKDEPTMVAWGTSYHLRERYPSGVRYDQLQSTRWNGGVRYIRTYKVETKDGWNDFPYDPRTVKFQLTFDQAVQLLRTARFKNESFEEPFEWILNGQQLAIGHDDGENFSVSILGTNRYELTVFRGQLAEKLYNAGVENTKTMPAWR
ncbi:MAG: hypothetical protein KW804_00650 [Candidatus Doudnabacteria bacterium]|nr:hypothetical protein [Candidatus Doudnabacteria bacterium]